MANQELREELVDAQRRADGINHALEQVHQCESLYAQGRIQGAAERLLEFASAVDEDIRANKFILDWFLGEFRCRPLRYCIQSLPSEFTHRCITMLERVGNEASNADKRDEAVAAYSTALSLGPTAPDALMFKWANMMLKRGSAIEASSAATKVCSP